MYDQNGNRVYKDIRRNPSDGLWYVNVFWGGDGGGFVSNIRRYGYRTRAKAEDGDISDFNAASYREPLYYEEENHSDLDTINLDHDRGMRDLKSAFDLF